MLAQRVLQPYLWEPSLWATLRINDAERAAPPLTDRPPDDASRELAEDDAFFREVSAEWGVPWEPMDNPDGAGIASQDTDSPAAVYMDSDADVDVLSDEEGDDEDEDYQSTESSADEDEEGKSGASSSGSQSSPERSSKHIDRARRVARRILAFTRPVRLALFLSFLPNKKFVPSIIAEEKISHLRLADPILLCSYRPRTQSGKRRLCARAGRTVFAQATTRLSPLPRRSPTPPWRMKCHESIKVHSDQRSYIGTCGQKWKGLHKRHITHSRYS